MSSALFADAAGYPDYDHSANDSRADAAQRAIPAEIEQVKNPATHTAAKDSEYKVLDESVAFATHDPTSDGASNDAHYQSFNHDV